MGVRINFDKREDTDMSVRGMRPSAMAPAAAPAKPTKAIKAGASDKPPREFAQQNPAWADEKASAVTVHYPRLSTVARKDKNGDPVIDEVTKKPKTKEIMARLSRANFVKGREGTQEYWRWLAGFAAWKSTHIRAPKAELTEDEVLAQETEKLEAKLRKVQEQRAALQAKRAGK